MQQTDSEKTFAMVNSGTFKSAHLLRMDSKVTTNRKSFLKRAGLAIAGVFAISSSSGMGRRGTHGGPATTATQGTPTSALARVRTAKGAVARKV
jgi:hypothetical protein